MTNNNRIAPKSRAAQFISQRIYELQGRKSQAEIATAAGLRSPGMLSMIKDGKAKLPIERAVALAKALECDPGLLVRLALEQTLTRSLLDEIFKPVTGALSNHERAIIDWIRDVSAGGDPGLTKELRDALTRLIHTDDGLSRMLAV